jgi:hypothetical protein
MDGTLFDDEMTQGDVHQEHKDGEQAEEQTEITDVEIEEREEKQNEEECSESVVSSYLNFFKHWGCDCFTNDNNVPCFTTSESKQAEEQTEITDVEIEERQKKKQNEEECSEKIEQTTNKKCRLFWKKPKRTVK